MFPLTRPVKACIVTGLIVFPVAVQHNVGNVDGGHGAVELKNIRGSIATDMLGGLTGLPS